MIGSLLVFAVLLVVLNGVMPKQAVSEAVRMLNIYPESGFYAEDFQIELDLSDSTEIPAKVVYTVDGSVPDKENGVAYTEPILVEALQEEAIYTYRFKAYYEDGTESEVITRTYFTGMDIPYRYSTMVLHLTGDPDGLFGYDNGIFVPGRLFDEFMKANPDAVYGNGVEANYNLKGPEYEREVYVQLFDQFGNSLMENTGGVRILGNATRMKNQKSFKLYARSEYSVNNEFEYTLFKDLKGEDTNVVAEKYKRLVVRNAGTDNGFAFLRSELAGALAADAGFPDVMYAEPVCVYINGQYQGIYWIENAFDRQYFENRYGEYTGEFVVLTGKDAVKEVDDDSTEVVSEAEKAYIDEYNEAYTRFSEADLTDDKTFEELCQLIDVYNYLEYFAIENYVGNYDWPSNNVKAYRYVSNTGEYQEGTVFDGRYRFLLFDVDYAFGLTTQYDTVGICWFTPTLERIMSDKSPLFRNLMEREDCRQYFVNYTCDLINHAMSGKNVAALVDEMHASRYSELYHMMEETDLLKNSIWDWEPEGNLTISYVESEIAEIKDYANNRPATVYEDIKNYFTYEQTYQLTVSHGTENGGVKINSITTDDTMFTGTYYGEIPVVLTPCLPANTEFDCWLVNGEEYLEEQLILEGDDVVDGNIDVMLLTKALEAPVLQIYEISFEGNTDYVEIINNSDEEINTRGYFLSDTDKLTQYMLPKTTMQPNETLRIYGKDCMDVESLGQYCMNFNLSNGETLTLSKEKEVVESVMLPDMRENAVYVKDYFTGKFYENIK